jgi:polysaccharide deacetylase 2 family uncharacterized protein YibQ
MILSMKHIFTPRTCSLVLILAAASIALFYYSDVQAESEGEKILEHIYNEVDDSRAPESLSAEVETEADIETEVLAEPAAMEDTIEDAAPSAEALLEEPVASIEETPADIVEVVAEDAHAPAKIAIIIDDMGPDRRNGFGVIKIDEPLTLAFLPCAERLPEMTEIAANRGHELMIHMPMEPENSKLDIGSIGLRDGMNQDEWSTELDKAFASFKGYAGLNNHMGSRLTQNQEAMDYVMTRLVEQGLYFVDSKTIATSVANDSARNAGLKTANRDVFLDHEENIEFVREALVKLEETAKRKGHAIAIGHPKSVTIQGLNEWIPTLEAKGIELVHASALVRSYPAAKVHEETTDIAPKAVEKPKVEANIEYITADEIDVESVTAQETEQALKETLSSESPAPSVPPHE